METETKTLTDRERSLMGTIVKLNERITELWDSREAVKSNLAKRDAELKQLRAEFEALTADNNTVHKALREMTDQAELAQMFRVLADYVHDDVDPADIGKAVVAYVDLLRKKAVPA